MWIADNWKEYEVLDASCGEKLERWGKYVLVRPDPQVIWDTPKTDRRGKTATLIITGAKKARRMGVFWIFPSSGKYIIKN